ncbi:MAG TPA: MFS transporter [Acidimicrobiales bacterium]|nr:MFS transporter [Acidimicrobiales bacterium]
MAPARWRREAANTFRSLHIRNYRLFFLGQLVSQSGTWMQTIAQGWLVLRLSHNSGVAVGAVTALQYTPMLLFGAWGGVVADRLDKRRLLIATQTGLAVTALAMAAVTLSGVVSLWSLYVIVVATGVVNLIDVPARQAFVSEMAGPEDVANAVGLNSAMFNASRILGPAVGGVLILTVGVGMCFLVNGLSFVAVIGALVAMRPGELFRSQRVVRARGQVREGLRYAWAAPALRWNLVLMAIIGTFALNFQTVLPLLAKVTFHGNAGTYSAMTVAMGVGALVGALVAANRARPTPKLLLWSSVAFAGVMGVAGLAPNAVVVLPVLAAMGLTNIVLIAASNTMLQLDAAPEMRGRVLALRALTVLGSTPIGGPIVGWVCERFGARWGLGLGAVATAAGCALYAWHTGNRRAGRRSPVPPVLADPVATNPAG